MAKDMGPSTGAFPDQGGGHKKVGKRGGAKHDRGGRTGEHLLPNVGHDHIAHPSHHEANTDHGTPSGFDGGPEYVDGGCDHHLGDNEADSD